MSTTADIRNGAVINFKNARMKIVEFQHVKPGKGPAFVRTKLKIFNLEKLLITLLIQELKSNLLELHLENFSTCIRMEIVSSLWIIILMIRFKLISC